MKSLLPLLAALAWLTGCPSAPKISFAHPGEDLPAWPAASSEQTLATINEREAATHAVRAQGTLTISDPKSSTRLDAIMLTAGLDSATPRLRLRATKLGSSVMDLVKQRGEAWLWTRGDDFKLPPQARASLTQTPPMQLRRYTLKLDTTTPDYFVYRASWPDGQAGTARAWVHRPTRTLHRVVFDSEDEATSLAFRYRIQDGSLIVDALQIKAPGGRTITLKIDKLENNPRLSNIHFKPLPDSEHITPRATP